MTEQQAIERIKTEMGWESVELNKEAFGMGIKALEEVQQLRNEMWELNQICRDYTSLGTVEELKEAKEKQIAKKPTDIDERKSGDFYYLALTCPTCRSGIIGQPYRPSYCKHCGQKLLWD